MSLKRICAKRPLGLNFLKIGLGLSDPSLLSGYMLFSEKSTKGRFFILDLKNGSHRFGGEGQKVTLTPPKVKNLLKTFKNGRFGSKKAGTKVVL